MATQAEPVIDQDKIERMALAFAGAPERVEQIVEAAQETVSEATDFVTQVFVTDLTARAFGLGVVLGAAIVLLAIKL